MEEEAVGGDPLRGLTEGDAIIRDHPTDVRSLSHGRAEWPEDGIKTYHMLAILGLVMMMGIVRLPEMTRHWDLRPMYDYPEVRESMTRDFFLLVYSRFFHMAARGATRDRDDPSYDVLHHIR